MKYKLLLILSFFSILSIGANRTSPYSIIESKDSDNGKVILTLISYCNDKKQFEKEAICDALRIVMFEGVETPRFKKPLLSFGESTAFRDHPEYFEDLYNNRCYDFVKNIEQQSKYSKKNGTTFTIEVDVIKLRKDLEKENVLKHIGY